MLKKEWIFVFMKKLSEIVRRGFFCFKRRTLNEFKGEKVCFSAKYF